MIASSLSSLATRMRDGSLTPADVLDRVAGRLRALEPAVEALLTEPDRWARLAQDAASLANAYPDPGRRPPLFGIPLAVKDIYNVDGFPTRAGSALPAELFAGKEASAVTTLRRAGCLILGKSVTTEFAFFEPGPTRNPRCPDRTPGGSSSGSAAAVAAGFCPLALGSQTVGSVVRPASFCGIAGFKTTYGLVSLDGVVPYAPSLDHFGFFTPLAADLPVALAAVTGSDPAVPPTRRRLGIPAGLYLDQAEWGTRQAFSRVVENLRSHGWACMEIPVLADPQAIADRHNLIASAEMARVHSSWFQEYEPLYRPRTAAWIRQGMQVTEHDLQHARGGCLELREELDGAAEAFRLDAWISPAAPGPPPRGLASTGDPAMNLPWTHAGLPVAAVPGVVGPEGLPLGIQLAGRFRGDAELAALAAELERSLWESGVARPPTGESGEP